MRITHRDHEFEIDALEAEIGELLMDIAFEQLQVWCLQTYGVRSRDLSLIGTEYELADGDADTMYRVFLDRLRSQRKFPLPPRTEAERAASAEKFRQLREEIRQESLDDPDDGQTENPPS